MGRGCEQGHDMMLLLGFRHSCPCEPLPPWENTHTYTHTHAHTHILQWGFPDGSSGKEFTCSVGDAGSIPGLGRSSGRGNSNPLQYSYLENPIDRGDWWATVHGGHKEMDTTEPLNTHKYFTMMLV